VRDIVLTVRLNLMEIAGVVVAEGEEWRPSIAAAGRDEVSEVLDHWLDFDRDVQAEVDGEQVPVMEREGRIYLAPPFPGRADTP
jgi:hypothetical protein